MGKREFLLVGAFVLVGVIVYQLTAPPKPDGGGFSIWGMIEKLRTEVRANSASAEATTTKTYDIPAVVRELNILEMREVHIIGEDRRDVETELVVSSTGSTQEEATALAKRTEIKFDPAGDVVSLKIDYPVEGRQSVRRVSLRIPRRLRVRLDSVGGQTEVTSVPEVELAAVRGNVTLKDVLTVRGDHRNGRLDIQQPRSVKMSTIGSNVLVANAGELVLNLQRGTLRAITPTGPSEIETRSAEVSFDSPKAAVRIDAVDGRIEVVGVRHDLRIDGRRTSIKIAMEAPAPVVAFTSDDRIDLVEPPGGFTLDAVATDGQLALPEGQLAVTGGGSEKRASGAVGGGGPKISLRVTRGSITIRK